jgi:hypothetical protein
MASSPPTLNSRTLSSGLAARTIRNLDFINHAAASNSVIHPVTQLLNSLLSLLVFPWAKEKTFFATLARTRFKGTSTMDVRAALATRNMILPSLNVVQFGGCKNLRQFFRRLRNALSHRHIDFAGDPDSRDLTHVIIHLKDCPDDSTCFHDWHIELTAGDLEKLARFLASEVISQGL